MIDTYKLAKLLVCWLPVRSWRHKMRKHVANVFVYFGKIYYSCDLLYPVSISKLISDKNTKCLIISPHPDDETIGCGGIMAKHPNNFDVVCINSSGVKYPWDTESADKIADTRIAEFNSVMKFLGIKKFWIFKIFGKPPMFDRIIKNKKNYLNVLNFKKYDYIFVPDWFDAHREHRFLSQNFIPKLMRKNGYSRHTKIVFYSVWATLDTPNYFEDISEYIQKKQQAILLYKSRTKNSDNYSTRITGLNYYYGMLNNCKYAEAFKVISIYDYLHHHDDKTWAKIN